MSDRLVPFLGFLLPAPMVAPEGQGPHWNTPAADTCDFCHRDRDTTYERGDGKRMCDICLDGQVNRVKRMRFRFAPRPIAERPEERAGVIGDTFAEGRPQGSADTYQTWWERQLP